MWPLNQDWRKRNVHSRNAPLPTAPMILRSGSRGDAKQVKQAFSDLFDPWKHSIPCACDFGSVPARSPDSEIFYRSLQEPGCHL